MSQKSHMPIREFSRLTGIRRENLRFYDNIGLLSPELRGENGYRYYTRRQLNNAYLINDLRELGIGLEEIKRYAAQRTPERMLALFEEQEKHIAEEMERLRVMREIMQLHSEMAQKAMQCNGSAFFLETKAGEPIFLGNMVSQQSDEEQDVVEFYDYAAAQQINLGYPLGTVVEIGATERGDGLTVRQYYLKLLSRGNAWKPEGKYAVAYGRCRPGESDEIYRSLLAFVKKQGLHLAGYAYEEYPLNEIAIRDDTQYCVRIELPVG